jgi:phage tail sheath protein FI
VPEYLHPGVHVEEIERGPRPIEGVPTSTAAILGETERGGTMPRLVASYRDYVRWFGDVFEPGKFVPYTVAGFFENRGTRIVICRVVGRNAVTAAAACGGFTIRAAGPGAWGSRVFAKVSPSTRRDAQGNSVGFRLRLAYWNGTATPFDPFTEDGNRSVDSPTLIEDFDDLVTDPSSPDFYGRRVPFIDAESGGNIEGPDNSALAVLVRHAGVPATERPADQAMALSGGQDDIAAIGVDDYNGLAVPGSPGRATAQGLSALEQPAYSDVALVYAPAVSADIAKALVSHCEALRFRFAVIDSPGAQDDPHVLDPRTTIADTEYAAFYSPWLVVADPRSGARTLVPPGGHVLGIYARSDVERGVFKAPANEIVRGALGLEFDIDDGVQGALNAKGVNVIRQFPGRGIRVWGARTLTSNALWKYVNVRRLFIFLERSIYEGTQWVVFEPNDEQLWARVKDSIRLFLLGQWRTGALPGHTEGDAFFITCDRTTMTQDDIANGRLICEIGIAPVRPAEFVIFRIFQHTAEAQR